MDNISVCRAAYVIPFIDVFRDIGVPVERELAKSDLPALIEEIPDDTISNILAVGFVARNEWREGIDDLGWLWAKRFNSSSFSADLLAALRPLPTVKSRLDRFALLSGLEDSDVHVGLLQADGIAQAYCDITTSDGLQGTHISEWTQVMVLIEIVRSIAGQNWSPDAITFKSDFDVCAAAREANRNTRFVKNANHTSIVLPSSLLAMGGSMTNGTSAHPASNPDLSVDGLEHYRRLLRPYLRARAPKVSLFAKIVGQSPRTLQRKLQQAGVSYSELLETTRFAMATEMLEDDDMRLIDIALSLGYENQSNFGRSFLRIAGMSPGRYRRQLLEMEHAA